MSTPTIKISAFTPLIGEPVDFGEAISFTGNGDRATAAGNGTSVSDNTFTMMAWVKPDEVPDSGITRYVTYTSEAAVLRAQNGQLHFYMTIDGSIQSVRVPDVLVEGEWQHLAGTYDGETLRLYHNGVEVGSTAYVATTPTAVPLTRTAKKAQPEATVGLMSVYAATDQAVDVKTCSFAAT